MTTTMEQMVIQLQQELSTLHSSSCCTSPDCIGSTGKIADHSPSTERHSESHDVSGLGRLTFFAGLIKESEMMLERASEQSTEISTELINRKFLPSATNQERGVQNLEFILQQMHTMLMDFTNDEANDIVANSRKNPLEAWRRLQKRYDPTTGGRKRNLLRTIISPRRCSLLEFQARIEHWESVLSQCEKMLKNGMNDEIKLGGLEASVPQDLERHLVSQLQSPSNF